jgi:hypothetical protein
VRSEESNGRLLHAFICQSPFFIFLTPIPAMSLIIEFLELLQLIVIPVLASGRGEESGAERDESPGLHSSVDS